MMTSGTSATLLKHLVSTGCSLRLFANDMTPTSASRLVDFVEPKHGYTAQAMMPGDWTVNEGMPSEAVGKPTVFSFTSPAGTLYGHFLTRGTTVLWAERYKAPVRLVNQADTLEVQPILTAS